MRDRAASAGSPAFWCVRRRAVAVTRGGEGGLLPTSRRTVQISRRTMGPFRHHSFRTEWQETHSKREKKMRVPVATLRLGDCGWPGKASVPSADIEL